MSQQSPGAMRFTGGQGTFSLEIDGSVRVRIAYRIPPGITVTLQPGQELVIEEVFRPKDPVNDERQGKLAELSQEWATQPAKK